MGFFRTAPQNMLALIQIVGGVAILMAVSLAPPAHGRMLLLPGLARTSLPADLIFAGNVRIIGTGPIAGSMVVFGDRSAILSAAIQRGILITAAPDILCGARPDGAAE